MNGIPSQYTMADALFSASFFKAYLRHADDVAMANIAPLVNPRGLLQVPFAITRAVRFMANGDWVAVEIEFAAQRPGLTLAQPGGDLLRIENGQIVEVRLFSSDQESEDAFWD